MEKTIFIGIDLGTSGVRAIAIDSSATIQAEAAVALPPPELNGHAVEQDPRLWWQCVEKVLIAITAQVASSKIRAMAIDGTSGTVLLADEHDAPLTSGLMYNDARAVNEAAEIAKLAPRNSAAHGPSSGLSKLIWLLKHSETRPSVVHTQSSWITSKLLGQAGPCDANNALKLGYDPIARCWPEWMRQLALPAKLLPEVVPAGTPLGHIDPAMAKRLGLSEQLLICAGTTDSTAAFIASGARQPGEAVTALGSTLVVKIIAERPVFSPEHGVYSHPLGDLWLVGGASNSGGKVLREFFSDRQLAELSRQLKPEQPTGLNYYPLCSPGERFPVCDPHKPPRLTPRPDDDARFFQGILEGIARIEKSGYEKLAELGAPYPTSVRSNGGGAANSQWTALRAQLLGVKLLPAEHSEAAFGSALLARNGYSAV